jgi:cation transport ATPase
MKNYDLRSVPWTRWWVRLWLASLITAFGFIAGCTMVIGGFLNARRDENWKMTVIYGVGVAGAVALMKAMFGLFAGTNSSSQYIGQF